MLEYTLLLKFIFTYITSKIINIFLVCAFDAWPAFTFYFRAVASQTHSCSPLFLFFLLWNFKRFSATKGKWTSSNLISVANRLNLQMYIIKYNMVYTGWLVTGGTSEKEVILREKRSGKYRIKIFCLRLCFRENRLWIFARYACTLSRLVITDLTVDRCLD